MLKMDTMLYFWKQEIVRIVQKDWNQTDVMIVLFFLQTPLPVDHLVCQMVLF